MGGIYTDIPPTPRHYAPAPNSSHYNVTSHIIVQAESKYQIQNVNLISNLRIELQPQRHKSNQIIDNVMTTVKIQSKMYMYKHVSIYMYVQLHVLVHIRVSMYTVNSSHA